VEEGIENGTSAIGAPFSASESFSYYKHHSNRNKWSEHNGKRPSATDPGNVPLKRGSSSDDPNGIHFSAHVSHTHMANSSRFTFVDLKSNTESIPIKATSPSHHFLETALDHKSVSSYKARKGQQLGSNSTINSDLECRNCKKSSHVHRPPLEKDSHSVKATSSAVSNEFHAMQSPHNTSIAPTSNKNPLRANPTIGLTVPSQNGSLVHSAYSKVPTSSSETVFPILSDVMGKDAPTANVGPFEIKSSHTYAPISPNSSKSSTDDSFQPTMGVSPTMFSHLMDVYQIKRYFLVRLAEALTLFGAPTYRIEYVLKLTFEGIP
jgi:hypothetical protein